MRGGGGGSGRRPEGGRGRGVRNLSPNPRSSKMKDKNNNPPRPPRRSLSPRNRRRLSPERRDRGKQPVTRTAPFAGEGYEFPRQYMMDHPDVPALEPPPPHIVNDSDFRQNDNIMKEPDFRHQDVSFPHLGSSGLAPAASVLRGPDTLSFLDGNYYAQPPTGYLSGITALRPENIGGGGFNDGYLDRPRDLYMERDKGNLYPNVSSFPTSSSAIAKDDLASLYRDRYPLPSDGFGNPSGVNNLFGLQSEHSVYDQPLIADPMRRRPLTPPDRYARLENVYDELDRSKRSDQGFLAADNGYQKIHLGNHADFRDRDRDVPASSFLDQGYLAGDSVYKKVRSDGRSDFREAPASTFRDRAGDERADAFFKNSTEGSFRDHQRSFHGDAAVDYRDMRAVPEDRIRGFGSDRVAARMMSSRDDEVAPFEDRYSLKSGPAPISYRERSRRERSRSPLYSDRRMETYRPGVNHSRGVSRRDNMDVYELSPERMARGKYGADDGEFDSMDERGAFSNDPSAFRRRQSPSGSDEIRPIEDRLYFPPSKRLAYGHQQHRKPTKRSSRSDAWLLSGDSSAHGEGVRHTSLKKRLRPGPSEFNDSIPLERRQSFFKPNKSWKKGFEDRHVNQDTHQGDTYVDGPPLLKTDPPEGSEEFKQQIHKAFLRFCKALNENPHQQKKYQEQGKAGSLLCCVCGRLSKQFVDTHSLVTHAYNSLKTGLKTEHLGLHKALCVLMGWNWLMPPETGKAAYQSTPVTEAEDLKTDLILWPPVVVVHNSSIRNKNNGGEAKVVTIEAMEEILREMGFGAGKTQVGFGRPSNQSVLLVKFMPTFSGLQEAERLHKHYTDNSRGRQEFEQIISSGDTDDKAREAQPAEVEETLYGYMAVAEDLGKLDMGTKKRSVVKSRKDIEAIADAPLNAD